MTTWERSVFDTMILSVASLLSLVSISHITFGWLLRKNFEMAVRSPLLLTMSGAAAVCISCSNALQLIFFDPDEPGSLQLILAPMNMTLNTSAYVLRGVRLLVMYNPSIRKQYGPYVKEIAMVKALVISYGAVETLVWSLALVLGVRRIARFVMLIVVTNGLLTLGASLALMANLRTTKDVFGMSSEIRSVGTLLLGSLALIAGYLAVPSHMQVYVAITAQFVRYYGTMWISNVQPVRALLKRRVGGIAHAVPWFPYVPWKGLSGKVVVGSGRSAMSTSPTTDGWLDSIMGFPPLLRSFEEYCRKALCIESLLFLIEVSEFGDSLEAAAADKDKSIIFKRFQAAIEKYVKDGAPFEINIGSKTKAAVLQIAEIEKFRRLTLGEISRVLAPAAKEVKSMLKDNVYDKFRTTGEYKQIASGFEDTA